MLLGITYFVDDRLDVLAPMLGIVSNLYLLGQQRKGVTHVASIYILNIRNFV